MTDNDATAFPNDRLQHGKFEWRGLVFQYFGSHPAPGRPLGHVIAWTGVPTGSQSTVLFANAFRHSGILVTEELHDVRGRGTVITCVVTEIVFSTGRVECSPCEAEHFENLSSTLHKLALRSSCVHQRFAVQASCGASPCPSTVSGSCCGL